MDLAQKNFSSLVIHTLRSLLIQDDFERLLIFIFSFKAMIIQFLKRAISSYMKLIYEEFDYSHSHVIWF